MKSFIDSKLFEAATSDFAKEVCEKITPETAHMLAAFMCTVNMLPVLSIIASGQAAQQLAVLKMMSESTIADMKKAGLDLFAISKACAEKHGLANFDDIAEQFAAAFKGPGGKTNVQ